MGSIAINNNSSLIQVIKQIAKDERTASRPADVVTGKVLSDSPLKISVAQKLTLTSDFIIQLQSVEDLVSGDVVAMIRADGGQKYLLLGKVK